MEIYSHSKLSTFESCPLKYKFKYIDKIAPEIKQTIEGFLGNKVHETLEWIYKQVLENITPELDDIVKHYIELWNKDFNEEIKIANNDFNSEFYFNQGIKFLIDYFVNNYPFKDNTLALEKKIIIKLDKEGRYQLQGYIDRITCDKETGLYEIHDYKTGLSLKTQEDLDKDRQLALYSIGLKDLFDNVKDINLIWHFLAFNKKMISKRTEDQLKELIQEIIFLIDKIESTKNFEPRQGILCNWCEFQSTCANYLKNSKQ
jgi:putative RecB family exonuclease